MIACGRASSDANERANVAESREIARGRGLGCRSYFLVLRRIHAALKSFRAFVRHALKNFDLSPIAGFTASFDTGNNSYLKLPDKYPEGYYATNAFHFTLFGGAKVHKDFTHQKIIKGLV